jgi:nitrate/TMAO reductase-like tetraheme cytochrome c subunit
MNTRALLAGALVLGVAGAVALLSSAPAKPARPEPGPASVATPAPAAGAESAAAPATATPPTATAPSAREPFTKASECKSCHETEYAEWQESMHGRAWTDPMVQALSNGFRMSECIDCHAPMPIFTTGISARVAPRQHSRGDGVDCLTCHLMDDGVSVAATHAPDTSKVAGACRPTAVPEMSTPAACAGCHNQHQTVDELAASGLAKTCSDCHMPASARGEGKPGRSHRWPGAHSLEMHQKAVTLDLSIADGALHAKVSNVGAGHQVPTDARHRSYNVYVSAWDEHGNALLADRMIGEFRLYYRDDFRPSTQIAYGKSSEAKWPLPEGLKGKAKVRLAYALNPEELAAKRVLTVAEKEIAFP